MDKLGVSKEVAEALDSLLSRSRLEYPYEYILKVQANENNWTGDKWEHLRKLSVAEMAQAIYVGYETEPTPEERVAKLYRTIEREIEEKNLPFDKGLLTGIKMTLNKLDIRIEGIDVNDN